MSRTSGKDGTRESSTPATTCFRKKGCCIEDMSRKGSMDSAVREGGWKRRRAGRNARDQTVRSPHLTITVTRSVSLRSALSVTLNCTV